MRAPGAAAAAGGGAEGMEARAQALLEQLRVVLGVRLAGGAGEAARAELREVDAALARLTAGTWGRCEGCGGAIGRDRLRALPTARRCLDCC